MDIKIVNNSGQPEPVRPFRITFPPLPPPQVRDCSAVRPRCFHMQVVSCCLLMLAEALKAVR